MPPPRQQHRGRWTGIKLSALLLVMATTASISAFYMGSFAQSTLRIMHQSIDAHTVKTGARLEQWELGFSPCGNRLRSPSPARQRVDSRALCPAAGLHTGSSSQAPAVVATRTKATHHTAMLSKEKVCHVEEHAEFEGAEVLKWGADNLKVRTA